jgi:hypothetical protein
MNNGAPLLLLLLCTSLQVLLLLLFGPDVVHRPAAALRRVVFVALAETEVVADMSPFDFEPVLERQFPYEHCQRLVCVAREDPGFGGMMTSGFIAGVTEEPYGDEVAQGEDYQQVLHLCPKARHGGCSEAIYI